MAVGIFLAGAALILIVVGVALEIAERRKHGS